MIKQFHENWAIYISIDERDNIRMPFDSSTQEQLKNSIQEVR